MKKLKVIGLMSGTSMDGINGSLVITNGNTLERTGYQIISNYSKETITQLKRIVFDYNAFKNDTKFIADLSKLVTYDNNLLIQKIIRLSGSKPDLVGFHGQTIYHNPSHRCSFQIGDGKLLSQLCKINVVSDFRKNDIQNGGQGAPISPIYHKLLIQSLEMELPSCFLNIGGVSNISNWDGNKLIGFDLGPGNGIMDIFCQEKIGIPYDNFGKIASKGNPNLKIVKKFLKLPYFMKSYPKSLDRLAFNSFFKEFETEKFSIYDILATLIEFTVGAVEKGIEILPYLPKNIVIMGGGQHNNFLIDRIKKTLPIRVIKADDIGIPGDFIEAEMIGYLATRRFFKIPITFPDTTGVSVPSVGGKINYI